MNNSEPDEDLYWDIDFPGMSKDQARNLIAMIGNSGLALKLDPILVEPPYFLTLHMDREAVNVLQTGLRELRSDAAVDGMAYDFDTWLAVTVNSNKRVKKDVIRVSGSGTAFGETDVREEYDIPYTSNSEKDRILISMIESRLREQGFYCSLDIPGMTEFQARAIVTIVEDSELNLEPKLLDPIHTMTLHVDRVSAEVLQAGLRELQPNSVVDGLRTYIDAWLALTVDVPD